MKHLTIDCACNTPEHSIRFMYDPEDDWPQIYVHYFLETPKWYKRIWIGIKYIFGYKCRYGHFGESILYSKEVEELNDYLDLFFSAAK